MKGGRKSAALLSPSKRFESVYACRLRERSAGILGKSCGGLPSFTDIGYDQGPTAAGHGHGRTGRWGSYCAAAYWVLVLGDLLRYSAF